ncbi:hypothetical protein QJS83_00640 [Bdellovibrio sp. 22V]|uniref:hypothetical protein n=1 Tax=Bdellovibrio TaxID=958 RepID=UPI002543F502|nr:hypothetical protein [Bdellovibrio sp. 22V]WII72372.1 hypothetical protein QJS83_00640 [Bdellovibrio sp. 22V]
MKNMLIKRMKPFKEAMLKIVIFLFFSANVGIMVADGLPDRSALGTKYIKLIARYQAFGMLYQPWSMFAPNPMNTNAHIEAVIYFDDGSHDIWKMPRQRNTEGLRKLLVADRYRLMGQETLLPNQNELVWFDLSKYILKQTALKEAKEKKRVVKNIVFNRFHSQIAPPTDSNFIPHGRLSSSYKAEPVFFFTPTAQQVRHEANNRY